MYTLDPEMRLGQVTRVSWFILGRPPSPEAPPWEIRTPAMCAVLDRPQNGCEGTVRCGFDLPSMVFEEMVEKGFMQR